MNSIASCTATKNILVSLNDALCAFPQDWEVIIRGERRILTTDELHEQMKYLRVALPHYYVEDDGVLIEVHTPETSDYVAREQIAGQPVSDSLKLTREEHAGQHFYDPTPLEGWG